MNYALLLHHCTVVKLTSATESLKKTSESKRRIIFRVFTCNTLKLTRLTHSTLSLVGVCVWYELGRTKNNNNKLRTKQISPSLSTTTRSRSISFWAADDVDDDADDVDDDMADRCWWRGNASC